MFGWQSALIVAIETKIFSIWQSKILNNYNWSFGNTVLIVLLFCGSILYRFENLNHVPRLNLFVATKNLI